MMAGSASSSRRNGAGIGSRRSVSPNEVVRTAWCGLVSRKERWGLSARGGLLLVATSGLAGAFVLLTAYPFLAVTERVPSEYLVVEGWVSEHAIRAAADEFTAHNYQRVFTTGGPVHGIGAYRNEFSTTAHIAGRRLIDAGVPEAAVQRAPARTSARDRTYAAAVALREAMHSQQIATRSINVLTEDAHARRTQLLYQQAFGPGVAVGVIAIANPDYDPKRWWRYSEGVRTVLGEAIAYLYAKFFFFPPAN
jgi:hypothetical protein